MRLAALMILAPAFAGCNPGPEERADSQPPWPSPTQSIARSATSAAAVPPERLFAPDTLARGRERYDIFCTPCHGLAGDGDGMAVQGGFPAPPSFHQGPQRDLEPASVVAVVTNGVGLMLPMAERIPPADRWAIAVYVKALQLSQDPPADPAAPDARPAR